MVVRTNLEAKNFRLMSCPEDKTTKENWTEYIGHRDDVLLEGVDLFKDYKVLSERVKGITKLRVMAEGLDYYLEFGEDAYLAYTGANPEFDTDILRMSYTSMTTPNSTFDFNMATKDKELLKQQEIVGDFESSNYVSERIYIKARDGVDVPVSIVYHKDTKTDGSAPCLLYGYGSYGNSLDPYFSSVRLSLLDRGFVYAIAHVRGGQELGRQWYEDGKLLNKKKLVLRFHRCRKSNEDQRLCSRRSAIRYGRKCRWIAHGSDHQYRTRHVGWYRIGRPFVDVVTTMLDETIPLTTGEYDEWGNPNDKEYYEYIKSYSPYDQVEAKNYPPMLVTTGLHDSQVQYWEPAKWVAKLREMKTDKNPLLLHTNMEAGHGGASGRFERYKEVALEYAFLLDLAGVHDYMKK